MKIGILTYHRAENYGALLQAYATKTYLESLGHDVSFVDYWPKYHSDYFKVFSLKAFMRSSMKSKLAKLSRLLLMGYILFQRKRTMQEFMHQYLGLSLYPKYEDRSLVTEESYDAVIYGSDQIWRKQNLDGVGFDDWYFGSNNVRADKKIVYAGSMGKIDTDAQDDSYIKKQMSNFYRIGVRETDLLDYLTKLNVNSVQVVDPVFLLTRQDWDKLVIPHRNKGRYILFYNLLNTHESISFTSQLSRQYGLPIYEITKKTSVFSTQSHLVNNASIGEFLGLLKDAEYVVSNSFHGVAFSIIYEKQFYAVGMGAKANRVVSLLERVGIADRYIHSFQNKMPVTDINYDKTKDILKSTVERCKDYLSSAL
jgi:hypothetical protein